MVFPGRAGVRGPVVPVLKLPLRSWATLRPTHALSIASLPVATLLVGPVDTWLHGAWLRLCRHIRRNRWEKPLGRGREAVGNTTEIAVVVGVFREGFAGHAWIKAGGLLLGLLRRRDQPEIMLGMLKITLRHDRVARGLRVARQLKVFFTYVMGCSPNFDIGTA